MNSGYIIVGGETKHISAPSKKGVVTKIKALLESKTTLSEREVKSACLNVEASDCVTIGQVSAGISFDMSGAA